MCSVAARPSSPASLILQLHMTRRGLVFSERFALSYLDGYYYLLASRARTPQVRKRNKRLAEEKEAEAAEERKALEKELAEAKKEPPPGDGCFAKRQGRLQSEWIAEDRGE